MAATPPPPKRIRTPPTPLHGPQHDTYEPYSPRRSSRLATRNSISNSPSQSWKSASSSSAAVNSAGQAFSPPRSPVSPVKRASAPRSKRDILTPKKQRSVTIHVDDASSGSDAAVPVPVNVHFPARGGRGTQLGAGMLPTPSKTPKRNKRATPAEVVQSTARVLFPGRPARIDDAMPPNRRSRKGKIFSLDGLDEDGEEEAGSITIYTDSKDRVPDLDEEEDNPFIARKGAGKVSQTDSTGDNKIVRRKKSRRGNGYDEEVEEMEKRVKNNEGMIYVFRGRKVFRRFDNASAGATAAESETDGGPSSINSIMKKKAGAAAEQRFTRSDITPRLLFPTAEQQLEREERARREEEEAMTDIEVLDAESPGDTLIHADEDTQYTMTPPAVRFGRPATPPSTTKAKKVGQAHEDVDGAADDVDGEPQVQKGRRTKVSPFDSWKRTKSGVSDQAASKGTKRERDGDAQDTGSVASGKRIRSRNAGQP